MILITIYVLKGTKRYVGITNNLERRLTEHKRKSSKGSQIIGEFKLVYTKEFPDYSSARKYEKYLKSGVGRAWLDKFEDGQSQPKAGEACEP
jgi:putative endonuclease